MVWFAVAAPVVAAIAAPSLATIGAVGTAIGSVATTANGLRSLGVWRTEDPNRVQQDAEEAAQEQEDKENAIRTGRVNEYMKNFAKNQDVQFGKDMTKVGNIANARGLMGGALEKQLALDTLTAKENAYANTEAELMNTAGNQAETSYQNTLTRNAAKDALDQSQQDLLDKESVKNMMDMFNSYKNENANPKKEDLSQVEGAIKRYKLITPKFDWNKGL